MGYFGYLVCIALIRICNLQEWVLRYLQSCYLNFAWFKMGWHGGNVLNQTWKPPQLAPRSVRFLYLDCQWGILRRRMEGLAPRKIHPLHVSQADQWNVYYHILFLRICLDRIPNDVWINTRTAIQFYVLFSVWSLCKSVLTQLYVFCHIWHCKKQNTNDLPPCWRVVFTMLQGRSRIYVGKGLLEAAAMLLPSKRTVFWRFKYVLFSSLPPAPT